MVEITYRSRVRRQHLSPTGAPCFKPEAIGVWYEHTALFYSSEVAHKLFRLWNNGLHEYELLFTLPYHPAKNETRFVHGS